MKDVLAKRIKELAEIDGLAGFEHAVVDYMAAAFETMGYPVEVDRFGNLYVTKQGTKGSPTVMVSAHSDEIGAMVKSIDDKGFIRFEKIGGTQDLLLPARLVRVKGVLGIVGTKAGHMVKGEPEVAKHTNLYIDVGAGGRADVEAMGIGIGDPITFVSEVRTLSNPDLICGKALDNRVSCAMMLRLFEELKDMELPGTVYGVINTQEEFGFQGAQQAGRRLKPDTALVVDTIPSSDTPDSDLLRELNVRIGGGPVLALLSGAKPNSYITHPAVKDLMVRLAKEEDIPLQLTLFPGSGSDAIMLHMVNEGIPCAIVNIPRRYAHSPVEMMNMNDVVSAQQLLKATTIALATRAVEW